MISNHKLDHGQEVRELGEKYEYFRLQIDNNPVVNITRHQLVRLLSGQNTTITVDGNEITFNATDTSTEEYVHPNKTWVDKSNLSGANVISNLSVDTKGHPTGWSVRTLTPADIGAAPASHTHNYENPLTFVGQGGATVERDGNTITISATAGEGADGNNFLTKVTGSGNSNVVFERLGLTNINWDASHAHNWDSVIGKPATYPPSTHSHNWNDITNKPATYPAAPHTHNEYAPIGKVLTGISFSGTTTKTCTLTFSDGSTLKGTFNDISASGGTSDGNSFHDTMVLNSTTGVLTLTSNTGAPLLSVNLDARYARANHTHNYENPLTFQNGSLIDINRSGNVVTVNKTTKPIYPITQSIGVTAGALMNTYWLNISGVSNPTLTINKNTSTKVGDELEGSFNGTGRLTIVGGSGVTLLYADEFFTNKYPKGGVFGVKFITTSTAMLFGKQIPIGI